MRKKMALAIAGVLVASMLAGLVALTLGRSVVRPSNSSFGDDDTFESHDDEHDEDEGGTSGGDD